MDEHWLTSGNVEDHINSCRQLAPRVTNYSPGQVASALHKLGYAELGGSFTQETWTEGRPPSPGDGDGDVDWQVFMDDDDDEEIVQSSFFEVVKPITKEFFEVADGCSPETQKQLVEGMNRLLREAKTKRTLSYGKERRGKRVSAKIPNKNETKRQKRQRRI